MEQTIIRYDATVDDFDHFTVKTSHGTEYISNDDTIDRNVLLGALHSYADSQGKKGYLYLLMLGGFLIFAGAFIIAFSELMEWLSY